MLLIGTLVTMDLFDRSGGAGTAVRTSAKEATVRMRLLDEETGIASEQDVAFDQVQRVRRLFGCTVDGAGSVHALTAATHSHLTHHRARRALRSLLANWPKLPNNNT